MKAKGPILLVEDDADDVFFISRALQTATAAHVDVAGDGAAATEYLRNASTAPSLVLLDLNLPHRTGMDVLKWIRHESRWPTLVVIILTSSTSESDMNQAYVLGANSYVIKPTDATKLTRFAEFVRDYWLTWNQQPPLDRKVRGQ